MNKRLTPPQYPRGKTHFEGQREHGSEKISKREPAVEWFLEQVAGLATPAQYWGFSSRNELRAARPGALPSGAVTVPHNQISLSGSGNGGRRGPGGIRLHEYTRSGIEQTEAARRQELNELILQYSDWGRFCTGSLAPYQDQTSGSWGGYCIDVEGSCPSRRGLCR